MSPAPGQAGKIDAGRRGQGRPAGQERVVFCLLVELLDGDSTKTEPGGVPGDVFAAGGKIGDLMVSRRLSGGDMHRRAQGPEKQAGGNAQDDGQDGVKCN